MYKSLLSFSFLLISLYSLSQIPAGGNRPAMNPQNLNMGRFYGRIVDSRTNKAIEASSVQLIQNKFDSASKKRKDFIISGQLTKSNGDFSLENLPVMAQFKLKVTAIGYLTFEQSIKFDLNMSGGDFSKMVNNIDVDLGNLKLALDEKQLEEVKVVGSKPFMQMGVDRKIFNIEKNLISTGQTATELMKNIPGVDVDIDGNVSLRNASPTIFVDGRPTTLTLDQIPSDAIESVELITNPSAKFDASGGMSGIINIILKKNRKAGYNGNLRAGIDSRAKPNFGGDLNIKQEKINFFVSSMINQRKSIGSGNSTREEFISTPSIKYAQNNNPLSHGFFTFNRIGFDYFINNRNTLTVSENYVKGKFDNSDLLHIQTDTLYTNDIKSTLSNRTTNSSFQFENLGSALGYKHLFRKKGMELTADVNFNRSRNNSNGGFNTQYFDMNNTPKGNLIAQKQEGKGGNDFYTIQTDYVNPISEKSKIELGLRAALRKFESKNLNYLYDKSIPSLNANYKYDDRVFAAYATYGSVIGTKTSYQLGLRAESSKYNGTLITNETFFGNDYPISLFPSLNITQQIDKTQDLQFSIARKIQRPNFFQILPFLDYSDSLNISRGNPALKPEFTNSIEMNYQKTLKKGNSILVSAYYKITNDLITRSQVKEASAIAGKDVLINTFINANNSKSYGAEFTAKNPVTKWLELTSNLNVYNSSISSTSDNTSINNSIWSFFAKVNANIKLPSKFTLQLAYDYRSKSILPQSGGGGGMGGGRGGMGGGGGWGGFVQTSAQGYINPNYGLEFALKKDFLKEKRGSLTLSMSDVLKTKISGSYSEASYFTQTNSRRRDWQVLRLNFNYRFGKIDASLFKRKNSKTGMDSMQEGSQMQ